MKTLLLLRHAKSSKDEPNLRDFDRPLIERGRNDSQLIGKLIRKRKINADLVISSPAKRARETTELVMKSANLKVKLRFDERIYEATARGLREVLSQIEEGVTVVVMIGHNPGFEDLFEVLTDEACSLPTASLACIELGIEKWGRVRPGVGQLKWLVTPKELK